MSFTYRNTDVHRRSWPTIQKPDGSTLELDPGETVELPIEVKAAWLESVKTLHAKSNNQPPEAVSDKEQ